MKQVHHRLFFFKDVQMVKNLLLAKNKDVK